MADRSQPILVVEDDESLRRAIIRMLESAGFATVGTGTAERGLALVREHKGEFALVVIDMMMPGITGLDLGSELSREFPASNILYISGYVGSIAAEVIARRSPDRVLLKPFQRQDLLDRVNLLLDAGPAKSESTAASERSVARDGAGP